MDGSGGGTWHQERDGTLCLWEAGRAQPDWWASRVAILERVREWFDQADTGWQDNAPDMDLERYWSPSVGLVLYDELPQSGWVRMARGSTPRHASPVWEVRGNGSSTKRGPSAGYVISIGEPGRPPRALAELLMLVTEGELHDAIETERVGWIIARYQRHGVDGVLALQLTFEESDVPECRSVAAASITPAARRLRAGSQAVALSGASVAVVGVGAIGSFVADLLARSAIGRISLCDPDILKPGNLVRHAVGNEGIGAVKANAVRQHVLDRYGLDPSAVEVQVDRIDDLRSAVAVLGSHDLVVNATGSVAATIALDHAAEILDKPVVAVATTQEGRVVRVDCSPRSEGEPWYDDPVLPPTGLPPLLEGGCGSSISPTPPWAVTLAAGHAARAVVSILTGQHTPSSYVQIVAADLPPEVPSA